MDRFFYPQSIVVIGASERPDNLARNVVANLLAFGYQGQLYAMGRRTGTVHGLPIFTSLDELPDGIDLAVILTPAATVPGLLEACGQKGIQRVVIESGGFGEFSQEGRALEEHMLEIARRYNLRFVGPNCISVINLEAGVCLPFALLSPEAVRLGSVSVLAQSGGVSVTYLDRFSAAGVGCNKVVSMGNKTDLHEADFLSYLLQDPGTEIICLYLESIGDGRELMDLALSTEKHIIVHKSNVGQASQRIAFSHTAALADDARIVDGALRQAGILHADGFRDAVAIAQGLSLPPVKGRSLVVISRSGGHAVVAADAAERHGFQLPQLSEEFEQRVRELCRANVIDLTNPLDLGTIFDFQVYASIVEECLRMLKPDAVLLVNTYSLHEAENARGLAQKVEQIARETETPVAFCVYSAGYEVRAVQKETSLPVFEDIDEAVRSLAVSRERQRWLRRRQEPKLVEKPAVAVAPPDLPVEGVLAIDQALKLCSAYGVPVAPWETAVDVPEALRAAEKLGYPVALKLIAADLTHKTDVGGVALGLQDPAAVEREAERLLALSEEGKLLVQRMVSGGVEVILGGKRDPSFGPVVMFGLGGVLVEVLDDVSFRVAPLSYADAEEMIDKVRGSKLLDGFRSHPPADREALVEALLAISRLLVDHAQIAEIEINPLIVLERGAAAVDARALLASPQPSG